jgi:putative heme degradation protein
VRTSTALRALNPIDLKINRSFWASAFVVMEQNDFDPRVVRSIRFYGRDGAMIHKLRLTPASSVPVFEEILEEFVSLDQSRQQRVDRAFSPQPAEFLPMNNWRERNEATFLNAPHSAWEPFALRLSMQSADRLFRRLMVDQIPVTVTVANAGCVQTRSGLFERTFNANRCVNIKAHSMNLHFSERSMARGWIVRSADGHTESLELYDQRQRLVASISPWRAAGPRVDRRWREALAQLCKQACAA